MSSNNLQRLLKAGIRFTYSEDKKGHQEIPLVQDVLRALNVPNSGVGFFDGMVHDHNRVYIENVHLVVAVIGYDVLTMLVERQRMEIFIAKAIMSLCPEEAKFSDVPSFMAALRISEWGIVD